MKRFVILSVVVLLVLAGCGGGPNARDYRSTEPSEYYVYFPQDYKADVDWLLFLGVHADGESGADCFRRWQPFADEQSFVLLCPTFTYSEGAIVAGDQLIAALLRILYNAYPFQARFFAAGDREGGDYVSQYVLRYPGAVTGAAALAPRSLPISTWNQQDVPLLILAGEDDAAAVDEANAMEEAARMKGLPVRVIVLPGEGDDLSGDASRLAVEFALQASRIIP